MSIEQQILDYCLQHPNTTFEELSRDIEGFSGEFALMEGTFENIVLWSSISQEASDALDRLQRQKKIEYKALSTAFQTYFIDGKTLNLPLARDLKHYRTFHWLPVVIISL